MQINFKALLVLLAFGALLAMASRSDGGDWFHVAEGVTTALILWGISGFLRRSQPRPR